jgi:hippurate hydrolase
VLAARIIIALQTIVSREIDPTQPAVVSIAQIHGGSAANIIPTEVEFSINLRYANEEVYQQMLEAIERICKGVAESAGLPADLAPEIEYGERANPPVFNDVGMSERGAGIMRGALGQDCVISMPFMTVAEDFALYRTGDPEVKIFLFWLGCNDPDFLASIKDKEPSELPEAIAGRAALHTPYFYPVPEPTIKSGIRAVSSMALDLLKSR